MNTPSSPGSALNRPPSLPSGALNPSNKPTSQSNLITKVPNALNQSIQLSAKISPSPDPSNNPSNNQSTNHMQLASPSPRRHTVVANGNGNLTVTVSSDLKQTINQSTSRNSISTQSPEDSPKYSAHPAPSSHRAMNSLNQVAATPWSKTRASLHRTMSKRALTQASNSDLLVDFKKASVTSRMPKGMSSRDVRGGEAKRFDDEEDIDDDRFMCIPATNNTLLNIWSYVIICFALYDAVTVPYRWAFWSLGHIDIDPFVVAFIVLDAISDLCSIANIYVTLHTAFNENGVYVTDRRAVKHRYVRSYWFVIDVLGAAPLDLIQLAFMQVTPWTRALKILRLAQVMHLIQAMEESRTVSFLFRLSKLLFYTLMLSHYTACIKYHAMLASHHDPMYYILINQTKGMFSNYLQMMYWALGSVTGRDDVNPPESFADAGFTVAMMLVGVLWLAYIIASMERFTENESTANSKLQTKLKYVTEFMHAYHVPLELQTRVKSYYSYLFSSVVKYEDDAFLAKLPSALRTDLRLGYASHVIDKADIFDGVEHGFLAKIVQSFTILVAIPAEKICTLQDPATCMYFIQDGEVEILIGPKLAQIATLRAGDYFGEYGMTVSPQKRTSTARSTTYCTLFQLKYAALESAMEMFPASKSLILARIAEHRKRTNQQEQNLTGLNSEGGGKANSKLKKLIQVDNAALNTKSQGLTINPNSRPYRIWFLIISSYTMYNAIALPLRIGYNPLTTNVGLLFFDYSGDVLYLIDILVNFRLRYMDKGEEIADPALISRRYLKNWFPLHLIASIPLDFAMLHMGMNPLWRMNRWIRLIDLHVGLLARMRDSNHWELLSLTYLVAVFVMISHFAACIYFSFTRFEGFADKFGEWSPPLELNNDHASVIYQYFFSQYYAMTLLAGIGRHIYPPTNYDVVLTISLMLIGVFVVSYLIGKVGHLIFQLDEAANEYKNEHNYIQSMFEHRKVDPAIQTRVNDYLKHVWASQHGIDPNVALAGLPIQLRTEIMMFTCEDMIRAVPKFKNLDESFIRALVTELRFLELPPSEWVFRQGQLGDSMYFISMGLVEIVFEPQVSQSFVSGSTNTRASSSPVTQTGEAVKIKVIGPGSFFGEGALLRDATTAAPIPTRTASTRANTKVQLLVLSKESFERVMEAHPRFARKIRQLNDDRRNRLYSIISANNSHQPSIIGSAMASSPLPRGNIPLIAEEDHLLPPASPMESTPSSGVRTYDLEASTSSIPLLKPSHKNSLFMSTNQPTNMNASLVLNAMRETDEMDEEADQTQPNLPPSNTTSNQSNITPRRLTLSTAPLAQAAQSPLPGQANQTEDDFVARRNTYSNR